METQEILQDIVFVLLYGGVMGLNIVAAVYLLLRRGNAIAPEVASPVRLRRWTAAFLLACTLSHVFWVVYVTNPSLPHYVIVCGLDLLMLFPTIAGLLLSMLQDRRRPVWPMSAALVPAFVLLVISIIRGDDALFIPLSIYVAATYGLLMLYMYFAVRRYGRWLRGQLRRLEHKEVWHSFLILTLFLLFFILYSSTTERSIVPAYLLQIDSIILVGLVLWRTETLQLLSESSAPELSKSASAAPKASAPQPAIPSNIGLLLKKHCEDKEIYLQHDLSLAQLAQDIGTNRYYLSQYFAQQGITYNSYINGLRIRHFIRLYQKALADGRTVTAQLLASESGYHSYSTFSAAFKQHSGKTVTAWMRCPVEG